jgi:cold shock CspA family protein
MLNHRKQGEIISWWQDRGFGILQVGGPDSLEKYFLHTKFIRSGTARPTVGQTVHFEISPEPPRKENQLPAAIRVDIVVPTKERKIYFAGRVSPNDWRHSLVSFDISSADTWRETARLKMPDGNIYVGPFFVACDHRCYHGNNSHGASDRRGIGECLGVVTQSEIFKKALDGIKSCDLFFAWAGPDFNEAYGTLVEIGLAHSLGKKIVIAYHPSISSDQWFALECAHEKIVAEDPISAYERASKALQGAL